MKRSTTTCLLANNLLSNQGIILLCFEKMAYMRSKSRPGLQCRSLRTRALEADKPKPNFSDLDSKAISL